VHSDTPISFFEIEEKETRFMYKSTLARGAVLLLAFFLSVCGAAGLWYYLRVRLENTGFFTYAIFPLIILIALTHINLKLLRRINCRTVVFSLILGLFASVCMVFGAMLRIEDDLKLEYMGPYVGILLLTVLFFTLFSVLFTYLAPMRKTLFSDGQERLRARLCTGSLTYTLIIWFILFVCWIPALLAYYPGIFAYDAVAQLKQVYQGTLTSHHPLLHTMMLYVCFQIGGHFSDTGQEGMLIYSLLQMLILSGAMAYALRRLAAWKAPFALQVAALLVFALSPLNALLAINSTKDVAFAALFLILVCRTIDFCLTPKRLNRIGSLISYGVVIFLTCLFRNTGVYIIAVMIPLAFLLYRRKMLRISICYACALAAVLLFFGPIQTSVLGVASGDMREALCVPIQQLSRAYTNHAESFTDEETELLLSLISEESLNNYNPRNADFTKDNFQTEVMKEDTGAFIKLWLNIGLRHPLTYFTSYLSGSIGFWYPDMNQPDSYVSQPYIETANKDWEDVPTVTLDSKWPAVYAYYEAVAAGDFIDIPVISLLFSPGAAFWALLLLTAVLLYERRYKLLLAPLLGLLLWTSLTFSPLVLVRYAYPLMICIPMYLGLAAGTKMRPPVPKTVEKDSLGFETIV